ncbi:MAG: DUF899 domain-containing protein [Phycisphaeraceae bacterium]
MSDTASSKVNLLNKDNAAHPPIAEQAAWLEARKALLEKEKELTRARDAANAQRRRLPMVRLEKTYHFHGPAPREDQASLLDLFDGRRQLIVYHFMFDPAWDKGCDGCTGYVDALGDLSMLGERDTSFALISRAPVAKLDAYRTLKGWSLPWYSSLGSDFNYDFHVTLDESHAPLEYNYRDKSGSSYRGEAHGLSVFFRIGDAVHHTYSTYARGVETLTDAYSLLDTTPWGRQEDFEDSPPGWPQKPTYG